MLPRRSLLGLLALGTGGLASRGAGAFELQEMGPKAAASYRANACSSADDALHGKLTAALDTALAEGRISVADHAEAMAALTCPLCGCRVLAALRREGVSAAAPTAGRATP